MNQQLKAAIGIEFSDEYLLERAFVHRSFLHEHPERAPTLTSNERLEFLGDAVLNFVTAAWLYEHFADRSEGELTTLRAALVKTATLARFARSMNLGRFVRISRGEDTPAARDRDPLLADVFEALLGAIFLDRGLEAARAFVLPFLEAESERIGSGQVDADSRTRLQEHIQALHGVTPVYQTVSMTGPDHCREFTVEVLLNEQCLGRGLGSSKQAAAQAAARDALASLAANEAPALPERDS